MKTGWMDGKLTEISNRIVLERDLQVGKTVIQLHEQDNSTRTDKIQN